MVKLPGLGLSGIWLHSHVWGRSNSVEAPAGQPHLWLSLTTWPPPGLDQSGTVGVSKIRMTSRIHRCSREAAVSLRALQCGWRVGTCEYATHNPSTPATASGCHRGQSDSSSNPNLSNHLSGCLHLFTNFVLASVRLGRSARQVVSEIWPI